MVQEISYKILHYKFSSNANISLLKPNKVNIAKLLVTNDEIFSIDPLSFYILLSCSCTISF